ncbi:hypothetical protein B2J93_7165 [Marssonina coronariae]|uniref:Glucose-methanol-choline oxidoreductase N-terminal domain-containing protein n=1 Tax=Diplocarpon coronariae TaxID=2795749 RepID=A0A218Z504_9HELO|nr:hypothetical protein B2J93_7165 [Marssonina coronariae]
MAVELLNEANHIGHAMIVGGGVAGCILASRLCSSLPEHPILLLEAGPEQDDRVAPSMGVAFSDPSDIQWNYLSVPQGALEEKIIKQSQGKVLGGSSAVNFQAWTRGSAADFDRWALEVGNERWSWSGMLPYFERSETYFPAWDAPQTRPDAHGCSSPIRVSHTSSSGSSCNYPLKAMVADVFGSAGLRRNSDINSGDPLGCGESACATYQGKRQWAASYPHGSKVTLWSSFQASKVLVVGERAVGVETLRDGSGVVKAMARREVIVCCGAQNSARLLLLGGTCAMGQVLDSECRVVGVERPRVVDASVSPFAIGAHDQTAVYAAAELARFPRRRRDRLAPYRAWRTG